MVDATHNQSPSSFERACRHVKTSLRDLSNDHMLHLYALFKQAQHGPCCASTTPKPPFWDFTGKAKWQSWKSLGDLDSDEAKSRYVTLVRTLDQAWDENTKNPRGDENAENTHDETNHRSHNRAPSGFGVSVSTMARGGDDIEDSNKTLFDWCRSGRLDKIKELITGGDWKPPLSSTSVSTAIITEEGGMNLLHCAADLGHQDTVEYLIRELSFNVNSADADGQRALHYAAACSQVDVVRVLLETGGVEVMLKDKDGLTALDLTEDDEVKAMLMEAMGKDDGRT